MSARHIACWNTRVTFALRYCRCSVVGQCLGYIYDEEKGVDGFLSHDKLLIEETCKPRPAPVISFRAFTLSKSLKDLT